MAPDLTSHLVCALPAPHALQVCMAARRGKDALDLFYDMVEKHGIRPNAIVVSHALQVREGLII